MITIHTLLADDPPAILLRPPGIARILGVPLMERGALLQWIEDQKLWHQPPYSGPLAEQPEAGTVAAAALAALLRRLIKKQIPLPFTAEYLGGHSP